MQVSIEEHCYSKFIQWGRSGEMISAHHAKQRGEQEERVGFLTASSRR
jgi:hypothetical protein